MKEERHLGSRTLIAQVRAAEEGFEFDFEDRSVRRVGSSSHGGGRIYLGDIVIALQRAIRSFHAPIVLDVPRFDEQRWVMRLAGERAIVTVTSRAYWGFGLMARCYLNLLEFEGESDDIASATHDLVAMLPHAPWTMVRPRACRRSTGIDPIENEEGMEMVGRPRRTSSIGLYTRSRSASHGPTTNVHILHRWKRTSESLVPLVRIPTSVRWSAPSQDSKRVWSSQIRPLRGWSMPICRSST